MAGEVHPAPVSGFEFGGDHISGGFAVPGDAQDVGLAADLAVFNVLLATATGLIDRGFDPLVTACALEVSFMHGSNQD
jgi:hypothetical protein